MGRRSTHTSDELRELIIEAATELIETAGLTGVSARAIARKIGYSPGTLYNVFQNLDDLLLTIEGRMLERLTDLLRQVPRHDNAHRHLLLLADAYIKFTHENGNLWNLLFEHQMQSNTEIPDWYQAKLEGLMAMVETDVRKMFPELAEEDVKRASRVLWAGVHGITSLSTAGKLSIITTESAGPLVTDLISSYIDGMSRRIGAALH